jgi:hypothetical protein
MAGRVFCILGYNYIISLHCTESQANSLERGASNCTRRRQNRKSGKNWQVSLYGGISNFSLSCLIARRDGAPEEWFHLCMISQTNNVI